MKKQILLYTTIYPDTAAAFISSLSALGSDGAVVRVNCPGGDPFSMYGMIAMSASTAGLDYAIDGQANSCAAYMAIANMGRGGSECLNVSTMVVHRAASWMEKYPEYYTDDVKAQLKAVNDNLRKILKDNIDEDDFKAVTTHTYDEVFDMSKRLDVRINSRQMKKLGIVTKVNALTAPRKKEILALANQYGIAAFSSDVDTNITTQTTQTTTFNNENMEPITTLAQLRAQYPLLVTEAETNAATTALANEKIRIAAWTPWAKADPAAVELGIKGNALPSPADVSNFQVKMLSPDFLARMKESNVDVQTEPAAGANKTEADLKVDAFLAEVNKV